MKSFISNNILRDIMKIAKTEIEKKEDILTETDEDCGKDEWCKNYFYTVKFMDALGNLFTTQQVQHKHSAVLPETTPTKESTVQYNYTFSGWDKDTSSVTEDMEVHPLFDSSLRNYTVNFLNGNGSILNTQQVLYGGSAVAPTNITPTKEEDDYIYTSFANWDRSLINITGDTNINPVFNKEKLLIIRDTDYPKLNLSDYFTLSDDYTATCLTGVKHFDGTKYRLVIYDRVEIFGVRYKVRLLDNPDMITASFLDASLNDDILSITIGDHFIFEPSNIKLSNFVYNCKECEYIKIGRPISKYKLIDSNNNYHIEAFISGNTKLKKIDGLENLPDTSRVMSFSGMFAYNSSLESLDLSHIDTSNADSLYNMFCGLSAIKTLDVSKFNTTNVVHFMSMFAYCSSLTSLDLTSFDTHNATSMTGMFNQCTNLKEIKVSRNKWVIPTGCDIRWMFDGCGVDHVTYID